MKKCGKLEPPRVTLGASDCSAPKEKEKVGRNPRFSASVYSSSLLGCRKQEENKKKT